jgi:phosphate butyryltransferase
MIGTFDALLHHASALGGKRVVVAAPRNAETFEAINLAASQLHATCILVGDQDAARNAGIDDRPGIEFVPCSTTERALSTCMELLRDGRGDILLKGSVDTGTLMKAVLQPESMLRTGRLLSDVFVFEYPARAQNKLIMITDGGITLAPDLKGKSELIANAVEVAHALGNPNPKVAVLSASEFVIPALQSTVDAAALSKMNERGQITGCTVDGPLALDVALFPDAAKEKGIRSAVAGAAEILLAPGIEAANSLAKGIVSFGGLRLAHVVMGARVPILIPSRADGSDAKLLSIALGMVMAGAFTR